MTEEQLATLLADLKNNLDITWDDTDTDKKLSGFLNRGMFYIDDTAGGEQDYITEGQARSLLFDYCRYARSSALEDFWHNYKHELIALRTAQGVKDYEESQESDTDI